MMELIHLPTQTIPFGLRLISMNVLPTRFSIGYTSPGGKGANLWSDGADLSVNTTHNAALAWDTMPGGDRKLVVWLDGIKVLETDGLTPWTGNARRDLGFTGAGRGIMTRRGIAVI